MMQRDCPTCSGGNSHVRYYPKNSPGEVVRCLNCGMHYIAEISDTRSIIFDGPVGKNLDPKVFSSKNLDDLPDDYWEFDLLKRKLVEYPALRRNSMAALERLKMHRSPGKLLDFGCGWGFFLDICRDFGWDPHGIEPLPGHSLYARSKLKINVLTDTMRAELFPNNFFDVVTSFQVFEHLPDPGMVLEYLNNFQKPGGIIMIEIPNINTWGVRVFGKNHRHFNPDHINFFSESTITKLLKTHGYQWVETYSPARFMTVHYLVNYWFRRFLPDKFCDSLLRMRRDRFMQKIISINLGDIIGIIAQKMI